MPAFTPDQLATLRYELKRLHSHVESYNALYLNMDDLMELTAPPEARDVLKRAAPYVRTVDYYSVYSMSTLLIVSRPHAADGVKTITITIKKSSETTNVLFVKDSIINTAAPAYERFNCWVEGRVQRAILWGSIDALLLFLNKTCTNAKQVRYLWPSILALTNGDVFTNLLPKILEHRIPRSGVPSLPVPWRKMCLEAATAIAAAQLLPKTADLSPPPDACVCFTYQNSQQQTLTSPAGLGTIVLM